MLNMRVKSQRGDTWFSPGAFRETLKLAPILMSLLIPFPWNIVLIVFFLVGTLYSALGHRAGRAWYDRPAQTDVLDWDYGYVRFLAVGIYLLLMAWATWLRLA
jgi:hypothetical protein